MPRTARRALNEVGDHVATWRKLRGLTQSELADRANVGRGTITRLEKGEGGVSLDSVVRILRSLGLLESFLRGLDPYESDVGRLRSDQQLPKRVRSKSLTRTDG
jgi:transcriptional regulator with XRE-family HTH domain